MNELLTTKQRRKCGGWTIPPAQERKIRDLTLVENYVSGMSLRQAASSVRISRSYAWTILNLHDVLRPVGRPLRGNK